MTGLWLQGELEGTHRSVEHHPHLVEMGQKPDVQDLGHQSVSGGVERGLIYLHACLLLTHASRKRMNPNS